ncbi:MAG: DUF3891 family protein [Actinomycetota bacterium]|nr:DUF3891 family protein [Actinomycetota bacterium]
MTRREGQLDLVTQRDHAALAGTLAEHWGNASFAVPSPRDALLCAAIHHDDGWAELDDGPAFDAEAGRPAHFTEVPLEESAGPYGRGVESVYERDRHAGVLVSMHWSGFSTGRWGVGPGRPSQNPVALEIVGRQEARWMPVLREVWANRGRRSEFDVANWHAYEVLQAVDVLSLGLALIDLEHPGDGEVVGVSQVLSQVDQTPGPRAVTGVPLAAGGATVTLVLRTHDPGRVTLDPYPFDVDELEVGFPIRRLPDERYASEGAAAAALRRAPTDQRRATLVAV